MSEQKKQQKACTRAKILAAVFAGISATLIVVSFFLPPKGEINSSVFVAVGELFAWGALFFAWEAVDRGIDAKITHGSTSVELNNPDKKED